MGQDLCSPGSIAGKNRHEGAMEPIGNRRIEVPGGFWSARRKIRDPRHAILA